MTDIIEPDIIGAFEQVQAPSERTPSNTREFFIRPPDWRYQTALAITLEKGDSIQTMSDDPYVQLCARCIRGLKNQRTAEYIKTLWPAVYQAIYLGTTAANSAITSELEAHIIHGHSSKTAFDMSGYIQEDAYDAYNKLFFDLSGIVAVHTWIDHFLFEPLRYSEGNKRLRARLLAYYTSVNDATQAVVMGMLPASTESFMRKLINNERSKKVFDYMNTKMTLPLEQYVAIMESAVSTIQDHEFQEHMRDRQEAGSSSLAELAEHIEEGVRAYSQQELDTVDGTGLDFVNQYTATILNEGANK